MGGYQFCTRVDNFERQLFCTSITFSTRGHFCMTSLLHKKKKLSKFKKSKMFIENREKFKEINLKNKKVTEQG